MNRGNDRGRRRGEVRIRPLTRQCTPLALALFLALAPACGSDTLEEGPQRDRFVRAYVALADAPGDPAARDSVLSEHGTTQEEMTAFVRRMSHDPQRLVRLWEEIRELEQEAVSTGDAGAPTTVPEAPPGRDVPRTPRERLRVEGDDAGAERTREVLREREEERERERVRELEREIERAREGRGDPSVEPSLDVAEPQLPPERVEEGLPRQADDL